MGDAPSKDKTLARRCAAGDPEAVAEMVDAYGSYLAAVVSRVLSGRLPDRSVSIEDVVGEVFLRLLESRCALLRAYRGASSLKAYLAAVARRTAIDALRRGGLRACLPLPESGLVDSREGTGDEEGLSRALSRLEERDRRILTLRYVQGLSYRDIGRELGVPLGTVSCWLLRARASLKDGISETKGPTRTT